MLPDDDVVLQKQLLLGIDVDVQIRIDLVKVMEGYAFEIPHGLHHRQIHPRAMQRGMGEEDEDARR